MQKYLALADRALDMIVPKLRASACCSASGTKYCCSYCGLSNAQCVVGCYCQIFKYCYTCS